MAVTVQKVLTTVFGSRNERLLKRYRRMVEQINSSEAKVQVLTDEALRDRAQQMRADITAGKIKMAEVLPEALAVMRESMDRNIGVRTIFSPDSTFDPDQFDDTTLDLYDSVQRHMISTGQSWERVSIPVKLYEAVRKLYPESRPPFRARCFDVQLIGGLVLYEGKIAEMATGEGKTFVAPLACFLRVLEGLHCHVVTVNDYLVRRDATWVRPAFEALGFTVNFIQSDMEPGGETRRKSYQSDVTYGTNSEFGFDYLRDNMKERVDLQVQGPLDYAIVDEVDSILIDEARTPLIISGAAHDDAPKYRAADAVARKVLELHRPYGAAEAEADAAKRAIKSAEGDEDKSKGNKAAVDAARKRKIDAEQRLAEAERRMKGVTQYYEVELDRKSVHLTHEGIQAAQDAAGVGSFYVGNNMEWPHLMEQSLRAHVVYERDKDYVIERGQRGEMEVVIVDEYTGRKMVGRQWSDGLHQAVEAKERVPIKQETQTLATITLQNFFKLYKALSGMTGTAQTEAEEFTKIYNLEVVTIPTNRPVIRQDNEDRVYRTEREKWEAIIEEIKEISDKGRPVLVGTTSVEKSEMLSQMLRRKFGVEHEVLNAKQHEREAQIVAKAGQQHQNAHGETVGNVTIATNMAGRGTDIKLVSEAHKAGGLHVIGTERHTARRIDNQLRGRGGRQGDPGSSRFYVSLQDDLMKMFAGEWTIRVLGFLGMEEGMAIEDKRISKGILRAQKKVEERNFLARKSLLEYDEVMDHQRTTFYGMRQKVLEGRQIDQVIWEVIGDSIADAVDKFITQDYIAATVSEWVRINFEVALEPEDLKGYRELRSLESYIKSQAKAEAEQNINTTLGEFMGEDPSSKEWDTKSISSWAMSRFGVQLSQADIRKMDEHEVAESLRESAIEQIEKRDVGELQKYLEPLYPQQELARWAKEKFNVDINPEEMIFGSRSRPAEEIIDLIEKRAREAYSTREIEYPVEHALTFGFGGDNAATENPYAVDFIRQWAKAKYGVEFAIADIQGKSLGELKNLFVKPQQQWLRGGLLEKEADRLIAEFPAEDKLALAVNARFGSSIKPAEFSKAGEDAAGKRDLIIQAGRGFLRRELTDLEQYVLISILDQAWKDHLYAMDMLKSGVNLQAFAERDPRVVYKTEGYRYFEEMLKGVRDKVTDLIFRARIVGAPQARSAYQVTAATHEEVDSYGVGEELAATGGAEQPAASSGGEVVTTTTKPIVRDTPKVGRNDACPFGSGKKYKNCHGANA
jgi:preprotein translocase subunit SecA